MVVYSPTAVRMFLGGKSHMLRGDDVRGFKDEVREVIERDGINLHQIKKVRVYDNRVSISLPDRVHTIAFPNRHLTSFQDRYNLAGRISKLNASGPVASDLKGQSARGVKKLGDVRVAVRIAREVIAMQSEGNAKLKQAGSAMSAFEYLGVATTALSTAVAYEEMREAERLGVNTETKAFSRFKFRIALAKLGLSIAKIVRITMQLIKSSLPALKVFGRALSGAFGMTSFIGFGVQLYTFVKKEHFYSQLKDCTKGVQDEAAKARSIFAFLQKTGQLNQAHLTVKKDELRAHGRDANAIDLKLKEIEQSYIDSMNYRLKGFGAKVDSARQWVKGKLSLSKSPNNSQHHAEAIVHEYMETLRAELRDIEHSEPLHIQLEMKHALLDAAHAKIHKEEAMRTRAREISLFASSVLASHLPRSLEKIDIECRLDQISVVQLHAKLLEERRSERLYDVVGMVTSIVDAAIKFASVVSPAIGAIIWMGRVLMLKDLSEILYNNLGTAVAGSFGISLESAAAQEIKDIFKRFKQKNIVDITHVAVAA